MGCIISMSTALDGLRFTSLKKGRVYSAPKVLLLDRADKCTGPDVALLQLSSGEWTVLGSRHAPNGSWAVMGYGIESRDKSVLKALVTAQAISQADLDVHMGAVEAAKLARQREYLLKTLKNTCAELGIPVPQGAISS